MNVTLFGATGRTGKILIEEGLRRGITLTVAARPGSSFNHPGVRVLHGQLTDRRLLNDAIQGADAVLSALGPTSIRHAGNMPITKAMKAIAAEMENLNIRRLIAVSTGTAVDPNDGSDWKIRMPALLIKLSMPNAFKDIVGLANTIRASNLDWTMVRVGFLTDQLASPHLNTGLYGHTRHSLRVSRADVASFMFNQIEKRDFVHQAPGISSRR